MRPALSVWTLSIGRDKRSSRHSIPLLSSHTNPSLGLPLVDDGSARGSEACTAAVGLACFGGDVRADDAGTGEVGLDTAC